MKNSVLKYDTISCDSFKSQDYTSKRYKKIQEMSELSDSNYVEYINLIDEQTIEQVSYILYETPDYWDLLLIINNRDPLFGMSYNFDILNDISETKVGNYLSDYSGIYKNDTFERLKTIVLTLQTEKNEKNRVLKVIRPEKITDFLDAVRALDL